MCTNGECSGVPEFSTAVVAIDYAHVYRYSYVLRPSFVHVHPID